MEEELKQFVLELKNKKYSNLNEEDTKNSIILKILHILGWDSSNCNQACSEYSVSGKKVDYCLLPEQRHKIFVEAKKINEDLNKGKGQLISYACHESVEIAVLTNGLAWWFYLPLGRGDWEQKRFFSIEILKQSENKVVNSFVNFLSKENVASGQAFKLAKIKQKDNKKDKIIYDSLLTDWNNLLIEPNEALVKLLSETNRKICRYDATEEQIKDFLEENKKHLLLEGNKYSANKSIEFMMDLIDKPKIIYSKKDKDFSKKLRKKPESVEIDGKKIVVKQWIDILMEVCSYVYDHKQKDFEQKIFLLKGKKRIFFSKDTAQINKMRFPKEIRNSGIYAENDYNTGYIIYLSEKILSTFGYDKNLHIVAN